jgi:YD repeat-containing protein
VLAYAFVKSTVKLRRIPALSGGHMPISPNFTTEELFSDHRESLLDYLDKGFWAAESAWEVTRDASGNPLKITVHGGDLSLSWSATYDKSRNLRSVTSPAHEQWAFSYDANGNRLTGTYPKFGTWSYAYDNLNRLCEVTNDEGQILKRTYSGVGEFESTVITFPNGETFTDNDEKLGYSWSAFSLGDILVLNPEGERVAGLVHDETGIVTCEMYFDGGYTDIDRYDGVKTTSTTRYDAEGRIVSQIDPFGTAWSRNEAGELVITETGTDKILRLANKYALAYATTALEFENEESSTLADEAIAAEHAARGALRGYVDDVEVSSSTQIQSLRAKLETANNLIGGLEEVLQYAALYENAEFGALAVQDMISNYKNRATNSEDTVLPQEGLSL